jgi:thiol-disulfide isomerase/thioredoxin
MRFRFAALWVLAVAVGSAVGQGKKDSPKAAAKDDRQGQLDGIIKDFVQARQAADKAMRAAKSEAEQTAAEDLMPKAKDFLPRVHTLLATNAKDDVAAEALALSILGLGTTDEKVFDALAKNFAPTAKIETFLQRWLGGAPDAAKPVLERVAADNPSRTLKGMAVFALGSTAFEKEDGKGAKEAEMYFERIQKEFADVKLPGGEATLAEMAKGNLFELKHLAIGMKAPAAESKTLDGKKTSLADHAGKVVVLDIWATWCGPCRAMIPHEREMVEKFKDKPFALISVSADDEKKALEEFLTKEKMPWTHWWDNGGDSALLKQWNVRFFPTVYVIDQKGVIRYKHVRGKALEEAVAKLLAEKK